MTTEAVSRPWYREPWPWILMAGPAIVVVAGISTAVIAFTTSDGLVADDYYKQGLAIDRVLARDEKARALGLGATVQFNESRDRVRVIITAGEPPAQVPRLKLVNATRAGLDRTVELRVVAPGVYEGAVRMPREGVWRVHLEDAGGAWRLAAHWNEDQSSVSLGTQTR